MCVSSYRVHSFAYGLMSPEPSGFISWGGVRMLFLVAWLSVSGLIARRASMGSVAGMMISRSV